jgi:hypothetical protein
LFNGLKPSALFLIAGCVPEGIPFANMLSSDRNSLTLLVLQPEDAGKWIIRMRLQLQFFLAERLMASSYRLVRRVAPPLNRIEHAAQGATYFGQTNSSMLEVLAHKITPEMPG